MRRFLLAAATCWIGSGAYAADLPVLRGGLTDGLSTSSVNWQGFYVGGQAKALGLSIPEPFLQGADEIIE